MSDVLNKTKILLYLEKSEKDLADDVNLLKIWFKSQPHLPEIPSDRMLEYTIVNNKFSLEKTKRKLDKYYSMRSLIPNIYGISNPKTHQMKSCFDTLYVFNMPKLVDDVYQVHIFQQTDYIPSDFNIDWWIAASMVNPTEITTQERLILGTIVILDQRHLKMEHIRRITPMHIKNGVAIMEHIISDRIKEFHFINYPPILDILLKLIKPLVKPKLFNRIRFHESIDTLADYVPKNMLPKDYGGTEKSIEELQEDWKQKLHQYQDRFDKLDTLRVNESLRPTPMTDVDSYGLQGSFKKLNVD